MKNLFLSAFALFSFSAFAQETPSINENSIEPVDPPKIDCYIGIIFECDEYGNPIKDLTDPRFKMYTVTSHSLNGFWLKQAIYCETGIIDNDC